MDGAALVVSTVVGAGIFTVPAYVAQLGGAPTTVLALWTLGGLMALAGALSYAELATRMPRGGAEYVYLREAFGPTAGFLSGWTSFIAGFSGAIAAAAVGFARHLHDVVPALAGKQSLVAVLLIVLFTAVSLGGIGTSRVATNFLALLVVVGAACVAIAGLGTTPRAGAAPVAGAGAGALSALVPIFFTYSGWNAAAYVAGEFRDPGRTIPRALIGGTLVVTLLYVGINAALLHSLGAAAVAGSETPVADSAHLSLGGSGGSVVTLLVLAALASSVCAMVITGPRIYREMALDGALPPVFGQRTRGGTPLIAAVAQSLWSIVLVLSGTFEQIVTYTGFAIVVFSGLAVVALFVLRRRHGTPMTYSVPGYPLVPAAFVICVVLVAIASFRYAPWPSLVGVGLIGIGVPIRWALASAGPLSETSLRLP